MCLQLYSVCLEGFLLGKARYSQLRRWDAQVRAGRGVAGEGGTPKSLGGGSLPGCGRPSGHAAGPGPCEGCGAGGALLALRGPLWDGDSELLLPQ